MKIGRPRHATVVAYLALFVALSGSALALSRGEVKTRNLANNAVKTKKIANNAVTTPKLAGGAVTTAKLANGAVNSAKLADAAVTPPKLACVGNDATDVMVSSGSVCIDRYEVSVWSSPTGGTQYGVGGDNYPVACTDTGQGCKAGTAGEIYARSVAGVTPSSFITYFQAQQALANSQKRLATSAEWQQAVAGTPDSTVCNISTAVVASTGANAGCVSNHGANDMVGNLWEWVADWVPASTVPCPVWGAVGTFSSDDQMCLSGASTTETGPGALIRGGYFGGGADAGTFAVNGLNRPSASLPNVGFRGAR